jgi:hypothetical protein
VKGKMTENKKLKETEKRQSIELNFGKKKAQWTSKNLKKFFSAVAKRCQKKIIKGKKNLY